MASAFTLVIWNQYDSLVADFVQTKETANRRSKITGTITTRQSRGKSFKVGPTNAQVGSTRVYSRAEETNNNGQSKNGFVGTITPIYISHDADGNASVSVKLTTYFYGSSQQQSDSGTWTLDSIGPEATACGAPTACSFSPTVSEGNTSVTWSGATAGTGNTITGYDLEYAESSDGATWGEWISAGTITTTASSYTSTISAPATRGYYKRVRVRTRGSAGASFYSAWKVSTNTVRKATLPTAPTSCSVSATLAEGNVTLSWSGAGSGSGHAIASYDIQYSDSSDNSTWGGWTALKTVTTTATSGSTSVAPPTTRGYYRRFRIRAVSALGTSYYSPWKVSTNSVRKNTVPTAPTSITASPTPYSTEDITLSWSGASAGTGTIKGYQIASRTSTDNATWSAWTVLTTTTSASASGTYTPAVSRTNGVYTQFGIWTIDSFDIYSAEGISNSILCTISACTAPTSVTVAATIVEGTTTLSWSGAAGGSGNAIVGYDVQYADGEPGGTWGAWSTYTTLTTTATSASLSVSPPSTRGHYRRFRLRTKGAAGASYYSDWITSPSIRKNTLPTAPTVFAVSPTVYHTGYITLNWAGALAGTSEIKQYVIQQQISSDNANWDSWTLTDTVVTSLGSGSLAVTPPSSWTYMRFRISVTDTLGAVSDYAVSGSIRKNIAPLTPSLAAPKSGATTYNHTPRVLIQTQPEPDGTPQTVWVHAADGNWYNSVDNPAMFSVSGSTASGIKTIFTNPTAPLGAVLLSVECCDADTASTAASRHVTVAASPLETITANITRCKASHIAALRNAINHVRDYYGLVAYAWSYEVVGGKTNLLYWPYHVKELRAALQGVIDAINAFAGAEIIPDVAWIPLGYGRPRADVMNQLAAIIMSL
jgi:hypothetical protein